MNFTPYLLALLSMILISLSVKAADGTITNVKIESTTTNSAQGSSNETEINIDFESTGQVDPTTGDFVVTCVNDEQEIHLTIPPRAWEANRRGGWSIIDPSDPIAMGITLVAIENGMEETFELSSASAEVADTVGLRLHEHHVGSSVRPNCLRSGPGDETFFVEIGELLAVLSSSDPGTSIRESEYLPAVEPQSGFIELSDDVRTTWDGQTGTVATEIQAQIATGGEEVNPLLHGVEITWNLADGILKLIIPPGAFEQKFLSFDLKEFRYQVIDPDFPEMYGIKFIFEDVLGGQTEIFPDLVDVKISASGSPTSIGVTIEGGTIRTADPLRIINESINNVVVLPFEAAFNEHDPGTLRREFEFRPDLQVPPVEICGNGIDDDGDGFTDFEDIDCQVDPL